MSSSLFQVLPILIIGFLFNRCYLRLRYKVALAEGQRLFFISAASGLLFAFLAFLARPLVPPIPLVTAFLDSLPGEYSDISFLSACLALFFLVVLNSSVGIARMIVGVHAHPDHHAHGSDPGAGKHPQRFRSAAEWVYADTVERG